MTLPEKIFLNAYTGAPDPGSHLHQHVRPWVGAEIPADGAALMAPPVPVDASDWTLENVGWGVLLPENPALSVAERATAVDAPEPIRRLVEHRSGVVLRWPKDLSKDKLRRYEADGSVRDPLIVSTDFGVGVGKIPKYLLMYGSPEELPWTLQYRLAVTRYVGRLDLEDKALDNYVTALIGGWEASAASVHDAVVWSVDHGDSDITHLMRGAIGYRIHAALRADADIGNRAIFLDGHQGTVTGAELIEALEASSPGLVVTTSHGMTGPLNDVPKMAAQLGMLVDGQHQLLDQEKLLEDWSPDGAIWYAHACCSAGSDEKTAYEGLVAPGSHAAEILHGVAQVGAMVAPLPKALLGASKPLRAFVGHVEPTFDWTLKEPQTGQIRTDALIKALYNRLYQPYPIGRTFEECHRQGPMLGMIHKQSKSDFNMGQDRLEEALAARLVAQDLESLVILGDPTAILPSLAPVA